MKMAAGLIGIIGAIFGFIISLLLFFVSQAFEDGTALLLLGRAEAFLSIACLVLSVVCISAKSSNPGIALLVLAVLGAILGFSLGIFLFPISMVFCAIAGALAIYADKQEA